MRLTVKLVAWFFLSVLLAIGVNALYGVRGELSRYESDLGEQHVVMGRVLRAAFVQVMEGEGEERALSLLAYTDKRIRLVDIRWVYLDDNAPPERRPSTPAAELEALRDNQYVHRKHAGYLRSYVPVRLEGRPVTALEFSESLDAENGVVQRAVVRELRAVVVMAIAIGLVAVLGGALIVGRPIRRLVGQARRIGLGNFEPSAIPRSRDELGDLACEMNAMCHQLSTAQDAKLQAQDQLRHAERLSTVGVLASGLAHELGTPLNVITLRSKAIAQGRATGEQAREAAQSIEQQATRVTKLVRQLLDFARRRPPAHEAIQVGEVVRRAADLVGTVAARSEARIEVKNQSSVEVLGDAGQLEQVFTNLLVNAVQVTPRGGSVEVTTTTTTATPPAYVGGPKAEFMCVRVRDEGPGIPDDVLPHVFEPFFTTKDVGEGTGLGLAMSYGIVRDHGGWIDVRTSPGAGSEFAVYLRPRSQAHVPESAG